MLKSRILNGLAGAVFTAAIAATTAGASVPSSPAEKAATAELNRKIAADNAAAEARAQAQLLAYQQQVEAQQRAYEQQKAQYEQQVKNAEFNR